MDRADARRVLRLLGSSSLDEKRTGWVQGNCPLAHWRHQNGTDSDPSFGIRLDPTGVSRMHCLACHWSGDGAELTLELRARGVPPPQEVMDLLWHEEESSDFPSLNDVEPDEELRPTPFSEDWLDSFPTWRGHRACEGYLRDRDVWPEVADYLELRWDASRRRVCCPIRDFDGTLVGLHGRKVDEGGDAPKYLAYDYKGVINRQPWLGENWVDVEEPLVAVEGFFDVAQVLKVYANVASPLSTGATRAKRRRMVDAWWLLFMFDPDKAGDAGFDAYRQSLPNTRVDRLALPGGADPGDTATWQLATVLAERVGSDRLTGGDPEE